MVDVATIFDEVFGPEDQSKGLSEKGCVRCAGVSDGHKPLENLENPDTPPEAKTHTSKQCVLNAGPGCAQVIVENQEVTDKDTPTHRTHRTHRTTYTPSEMIDENAFEERAAIMEFDGEMAREEAERHAMEEASRRFTTAIGGLS